MLTQGELDNGRGRARLNLFRHLHEIESGRTSSISHEILGFNSKGKVYTLQTRSSIQANEYKCQHNLVETARKFIMIRKTFSSQLHGELQLNTT